MPEGTQLDPNLPSQVWGILQWPKAGVWAKADGTLELRNRDGSVVSGGGGEVPIPTYAPRTSGASLAPDSVDLAAILGMARPGQNEPGFPTWAHRYASYRMTEDDLPESAYKDSFGNSRIFWVLSPKDHSSRLASTVTTRAGTTITDANDGLDILGFGLTGATYNPVGRTLTAGSGTPFASYTRLAGDRVYLSSGVTPGLYAIESVTSSTVIVLAADARLPGVSTGGVNSSTGPWATMHLKANSAFATGLPTLIYCEGIFKEALVQSTFSAFNSGTATLTVALPANYTIAPNQIIYVRDTTGAHGASRITAVVGTAVTVVANEIPAGFTSGKIFFAPSSRVGAKQRIVGINRPTSPMPTQLSAWSQTIAPLNSAWTAHAMDSTGFMVKYTLAAIQAQANTAITMTNNGSGYNPDTCTIDTAAGSSGSIFPVVDTLGGVAGYHIAAGGTGYVTGETVRVIGANGGKGAIGIITAAAGVITAVAPKSFGTGYVSPPLVTFGGTGAATVTARAIVKPDTGTVSAVVPLRIGTGGVSGAITCTIAAPLSGTTATATVATPVNGRVATGGGDFGPGLAGIRGWGDNSASATFREAYGIADVARMPGTYFFGPDPFNSNTWTVFLQMPASNFYATSPDAPGVVRTKLNAGGPFTIEFLLPNKVDGVTVVLADQAMTENLITTGWGACVSVGEQDYRGYGFVTFNATGMSHTMRSCGATWMNRHFGGDFGYTDTDTPSMNYVDSWGAYGVNGADYVCYRSGGGHIALYYNCQSRGAKTPKGTLPELNSSGSSESGNLCYGHSGGVRFSCVNGQNYVTITANPYIPASAFKNGFRFTPESGSGPTGQYTIDYYDPATRRLYLTSNVNANSTANASINGSFVPYLDGKPFALALNLNYEPQFVLSMYCSNRPGKYQGFGSMAFESYVHTYPASTAAGNTFAADDPGLIRVIEWGTQNFARTLEPEDLLQDPSLTLISGVSLGSVPGVASIACSNEFRVLLTPGTGSVNPVIFGHGVVHNCKVRIDMGKTTTWSAIRPKCWLGKAGTTALRAAFNEITLNAGGSSIVCGITDVQGNLLAGVFTGEYRANIHRTDEDWSPSTQFLPAINNVSGQTKVSSNVYPRCSVTTGIMGVDNEPDAKFYFEGETPQTGFQNGVPVTLGGKTIGYYADGSTRPATSDISALPTSSVVAATAAS